MNDQIKQIHDRAVPLSGTATVEYVDDDHPEHGVVFRDAKGRELGRMPTRAYVALRRGVT